MKIIVYANENKDNKLVKTKEIVNYLKSKDVDVYILFDMFKYFEGNDVTVYNNEMDINFVLSIGGDGTFLRSLDQLSKLNAKFIALNQGRVGYLTSGKINEYKNVIDKIISNKYSVFEKSFLNVEINLNDEKKTISSFNEVVIHRGSSLNMLNISMNIDDESIVPFYADGCIVSTQIGSSAYNLSAGGPFIFPNCDSFVMTPICSQFGLMPSVVYNSNSILTINAQTKRNASYLVTIDGRVSLVLNSSDCITISKAPKRIKIVDIKNDKKHLEKLFSNI